MTDQTPVERAAAVLALSEVMISLQSAVATHICDRVHTDRNDEYPCGECEESVGNLLHDGWDQQVIEALAPWRPMTADQTPVERAAAVRLTQAERRTLREVTMGFGFTHRMDAAVERIIADRLAAEGLLTDAATVNYADELDEHIAESMADPEYAEAVRRLDATIRCENCGATDLGCTACGAHGTLTTPPAATVTEGERAALVERAGMGAVVAAAESWGMALASILESEGHDPACDALAANNLTLCDCWWGRLKEACEGLLIVQTTARAALAPSAAPNTDGGDHDG